METYNCKNIYYNLPLNTRQVFRTFISFLKKRNVYDDFFNSIDFDFAEELYQNMNHKTIKITNLTKYFQVTHPSLYIWNAWDWQSDFWRDINREWQFKTYK